MAEQVDLTTPVSRGTTTNYHLQKLVLDIDALTIYVQLVSNAGDLLPKVYDSTTSPTGAALLSSLNTSNNTTTSLIKRVYNQLVASGVIAGTVSGTPQ